MANFFAYFKPTERRKSRCILFLLCCPAHLGEKVKQDLENEGITANDTTSRRTMIPGHDKAYVFVSRGVRPACTEDMEDFYLRLVSKGLTWFCANIARNRGHFAPGINCQRNLIFKMADKNYRSQGKRIPYDIFNNLKK